MTRELDDPLQDLFNSAESNVVPLRRTPPANFVPATERAVPPSKPYHRITREPTRRRTGRGADAAIIEGWRHDFPAEFEWMTEKARINQERNGAFTFPQAMIDAVVKYGSLTDNQLATVRRLMAKDAARDQARARASVVEADRTAALPVVDVSKLQAAFDRARALASRANEGLKFLHLRLDTFVFSPAGANSRNPGALYVKENKVYLGKVQDG